MAVHRRNVSSPYSVTVPSVSELQSHEMKPSICYRESLQDENHAHKRVFESYCKQFVVSSRDYDRQREPYFRCQ